jgi:hypothetical protein
VLKPAHGAVITSATLRDSLGVPNAANDDQLGARVSRPAHESERVWRPGMRRETGKE